MGIAGAVFKTINGLRKSRKFNKAIKKLSDINNKKIHELTADKTNTDIYLAQLELYELRLNNAPITTITNLEKKVIELMNNHINAKRADLQSKNATQLDIANIIISIQKLQHETAANFRSLAEECVDWSDKSRTEYNSLTSEIEQNEVAWQKNYEKYSSILEIINTNAENNKNNISQINDELGNFGIKVQEIKNELENVFFTKIKQIDSSITNSNKTNEKFQNQLHDYRNESLNKTETLRKEFENNLKIHDYKLVQKINNYIEEFNLEFERTNSVLNKLELEVSLTNKNLIDQNELTRKEIENIKIDFDNSLKEQFEIYKVRFEDLQKETMSFHSKVKKEVSMLHDRNKSLNNEIQNFKSESKSDIETLRIALTNSIDNQSKEFKNVLASNACEFGDQISNVNIHFSKTTDILNSELKTTQDLLKHSIDNVNANIRGYINEIKGENAELRKSQIKSTKSIRILSISLIVCLLYYLINLIIK